MKNIVIIGCGSGIGLATAKQLQDVLSQIIAYLEAHQVQTVEKSTTQQQQASHVDEVNNPFL